jgi:chorismate synthase
MHFNFRTAGESHGRGLVCMIEGVPAGLALSSARDIDPDLRRRQGGYGRGGRMKIERDTAEVVAGIRLGETIGSPLAFLVWNRDWENWRVAMDPEAPAGESPRLKRVHLPRPGHADLVGVLKYDRADARDILERASARETTARVVAGAVAKRLLAEFDITIGSHIVMMGGIEAKRPDPLPDDINAAADASPVRTLDPDAESRMIEAIDDAKSRGDTLGGVFEVVARDDVDPGHEGRGDRDGLRGGSPAGLTGTRRDRTGPRAEEHGRVPASVEQRGRARGRDHDR